MTRIVYLHQYFKTPSATGGTRSYEFARRLAAAGFDVHVVASDVAARSEQSGWRTEGVAGFTVHWVPIPYSNYMSFRRRIAAFAQFAARASVRSRALRGDVIFATSTPLTIIIPAWASMLLRRASLVFEVRDLWPEMPIAVGALRGRVAISLARWLERAAYRSAAEIIALSPGMKDGVTATGYPADRVTVIPNGADLELFATTDDSAHDWVAAHPELAERPTVVYAGTLGRVNKVGYLVEIAAKSETLNDTAFVVVGDGAERESIRRKAETAGVLGRNFFLYPPVAKAEVPSLLHASTICTSLFAPLPEMEANSANKFFDALAAGKPVAINYGGWHRTLLEESGAGFVMDPVSPARAAAQLDALVKDSEALARMAVNARGLAESEFSRDLLANRLKAVIERVSVQQASGRTRRRA